MKFNCSHQCITLISVCFKSLKAHSRHWTASIHTSSAGIHTYSASILHLLCLYSHLLCRYSASKPRPCWPSSVLSFINMLSPLERIRGGFSSPQSWVSRWELLLGPSYTFKKTFWMLDGWDYQHYVKDYNPEVRKKNIFIYLLCIYIINKYIICNHI